MTHEEKIAAWIGPGKIGTEIGAGASPVPGLEPRPIYIDCFKAFGAEPNHADYYGHACALPFHDHSLDYVVASHVLEHVANPIAALAEWYRVLRPGGIIYLVVPHRLCTWDHPRELTTVAHLWEDYARGTTACDATHIDEFARDLDWSRFNPATPAQEIPAKRAELARGMHEAVERGEDINIHFHTFEPANLRELLETLTQPPASQAKPLDAPTSDRGGPGGSAHPPRFNWEIVDLAEGFPEQSPNGILAVLRVDQGWLARAQAEVFRLKTQGVPQAALRPGAEPFAAWSARTSGLGGVR